MMCTSRRSAWAGHRYAIGWARFRVAFVSRDSREVSAAAYALRVGSSARLAMTAHVDAERVALAPAGSSLEKPAAPAELSPEPQTVRSTGTHPSSPRRRPWLLEARSSVLLIAFMAAWGLLADLAVYGIVVPVVPFRLQQLGYADDQIASLTRSVSEPVTRPLTALAGSLRRMRVG